MYELGASNFSVSGLPPIGCLPVQLTFESFKKIMMPRPGKCIQEQNDAAVSYNIKLQKMIEELLVQFNSKEKIRAAYFDTYSPLFDMSNNPRKYGFTETKKGCCGKGLIEVGPLRNSLNSLWKNPSRYMFFDSVHGTQATDKAVSKDVMKLVFAMLAN